MAEVREFVEMVEAFERLAEELRTLGPEQREKGTRRLRELSAQMLQACDGPQLEKLVVWHVDHFYRLLHRLSMLDHASFAVAHALGASLVHRLLHCGTSIAYLVDNQIAHDRLVAARPLFSAMGLVVASPELLAFDLALQDGLEVEDINGEHLPHYQMEAIALAMQLFDQSVGRGSPVIWLSGVCDLDVYAYLARRLDETGYVGVFRNQAPVDGSEVQVFRDSSGQVDIDAKH